MPSCMLVYRLRSCGVADCLHLRFSTLQRARLLIDTAARTSIFENYPSLYNVPHCIDTCWYVALPCIWGWSVKDELLQFFILWSKRRRRSRKFWTSGPNRQGCSLESVIADFFRESFWYRKKMSKFYLTFSGLISLGENEKDTYLLQIIYLLEGNDSSSVFQRHARAVDSTGPISTLMYGLNRR